MQKLKSKDLKEYRLHLLAKQGNVCAICKLACTEEQAVLDHDHSAGHVRAVLHRGCNAVEGKIINAIKRYGIKDPRGYLNGLVAYHVLHEQNMTGLIHPTHRTPDEKKVLLKKRVARKKKAKKAQPKI